MKIKKGYVNIIALLALSLVIQNSYAASDASWWSKWAPSGNTLTSMSWVAPAAIMGAQRALAPESKIPAYSYFIPGALGTAFGTCARSDQGWGSAFLTSLLHQSPSFALAALLWANEKWNRKSPEDKNLEIFNKLPGKLKKYQHDMSILLRQFNEAMYKAQGPDVILFEHTKNEYARLTALRNEIRKENDQLNDARNLGIFSSNISPKQFVDQYDLISGTTQLTPSQELYASYIAYLMALDNYMVPVGSLSENDVTRIKKDIEDNSIRLSLIEKLYDQGIINDNPQAFEAEIKTLLSGDSGMLVRTIVNNIITHRIQMPPQQMQLKGTFPEDKKEIQEEEAILGRLLKRYREDIESFVNTLFSDTSYDLNSILSPLYNNISLLYQSIQESAGWLREQGATQISEGNLLLAPYDYISAAVAARIIKPDVKFVLTKNAKPSMDLVFAKMQDPVLGKHISDILKKSQLLMQDIMAADSKEDNNRSVRLINKVIQLINIQRKVDAEVQKKLEQDLESAFEETMK